MGSLKLMWVGGVLVFMQLIPAILGWGDHGHYITCKIAEGFLTRDTMEAVKELLPENADGELAAVCSWPDLKAVRSQYPWSTALHFSDTPDFKCNYDYFRDCHDSYGNKNRCVNGGIYNYTLQLQSASHESGYEVKYNLTEALMFLSHFLGDIHQPLHIGFLGDLGGNKVQVQWYNTTANLHHVWDTSIIDTALEKFYDSNVTNMIQAIQNNITDDWSNYVVSWQSCDPNQTVCPDLYASDEYFSGLQICI